MSAILVKMPPAMRRAEAPSDSPMAKPRKQIADDLPRHEQQDDDHHHQLERDQEQADRHAGPQRDVDHVPGLAAQRGEGGAAVGVGVDADAVPGHRVGAAHADDGEEQHENERGDGADVLRPAAALSASGSWPKPSR